MEKLIKLIDTQWIEENPDSALELVQCLWHELKFRKDYIQQLEYKLLAANVMVENK